MRKRNANKNGFGLVELVVGIAVIFVAFFGFMATTRDLLRLSESNTERLKVSYLLEEGVELARLLRDQGWQTFVVPLSTTTEYYFSFDPVTLLPKATTAPSSAGIFQRKFSVREVRRNLNKDISQTGAIDPDTKEFVITVTWPGIEGANVMSVGSYLTNFFND